MALKFLPRRGKGILSQQSPTCNFPLRSKLPFRFLEGNILTLVHKLFQHCKISTETDGALRENKS